MLCTQGFVFCDRMRDKKLARLNQSTFTCCRSAARKYQHDGASLWVSCVNKKIMTNHFPNPTRTYDTDAACQRHCVHLSRNKQTTTRPRPHHNVLNMRVHLCCIQYQTLLGPQPRFGGKLPRISTGLSPKRDYGSKRDKFSPPSKHEHCPIYLYLVYMYYY